MTSHANQQYPVERTLSVILPNDGRQEGLSHITFFLACQEEEKMNKTILQRSSSTPVPNTFIARRRTNLHRRQDSVPIKFEVTWETLSNASCSRQQGSPRITNELKLPEITTAQHGMNCQDLGHVNLDVFGKTILTGRKLSLLDNFSMKTNLTQTSQRQDALQEECSYNHFQRELVKKETCKDRCEALRQFITNAEANFDSNKAKAAILCNWLSSQSILYGL